jgi:hypothetical protein
MRSYKDNRWFVYADAQSNKMRAYVEALPDDWEWTWLLPPEDQSDARDWDRLHRWADRIGVRCIHVPWMDNVLEGRYFIPMRELIDVVLGFDPDVLLCEVPEHARAWRAIQRACNAMTGVERSFPIISMVEHVDFYKQTTVPEEVAYYLRQLDGALVSDRIAFPLEGMRKEWSKAYSHLLEDRFWLDEKMVTWNAIYSPREVDEWVGDVFLEDGAPAIYFISRLSDNQRTHYEEFFEACRILQEEGREFQLWVADPNEAGGSYDKLQGQLGLNHVITHWGTRSRDNYLARLHGASVVPILYPQSHIYSLGFCEAISAQNLVVTTTDPQGNQLLPGVTSMHPSEVTKESVAAALREALDNHDSLIREEQEEWLLEDRSVEANIDKVRTTIEEVVGVTA